MRGASALCAAPAQGVQLPRLMSRQGSVVFSTEHRANQRLLRALGERRREAEREAAARAAAPGARRDERGGGGRGEGAGRRAGTMADLLMRIDNRSGRRLQRAFRRENVIKVDRFVEIICANINPGELTREEIVEMAVELFDQIDANGDGTLHWSEFAAFIIELNHAHDIQLADRDVMHICPVRDASMRINVQRRAVSALVCEFSGAVCIVEKKSDQLRIHRLRKENKSLRPLLSVRVTSNFISHEVVAGCHLESIGMAVVASRLGEKFFLTSYLLDKVIGQHEQIATLSGQRILRWHPDSETLCTVGTGRGDAKGHVVSVFHRNERSRALLDTKVGRLIWHHKRITEMLFVTHKHLATASEDGSLAIWDVTNFEQLSAVVAHSVGVLSFSLQSFVPDTTGFSSFWTRVKTETVLATFVTAPCTQFGGHISKPKEACAQVWEVADSFNVFRPLAHLLGHEHPTTYCTLIMQGAYVLTCDLSGEARLWSANHAYSCIQRLDLGCSQILCLHDTLITLAAMHGTDAIYALRPAEKDRSPIVMAVFNHTMGCLVTVTKQEVVLWDIRSGEHTPVVSMPEHAKRDITAACLDDRERKLIVGDESGRLFVFNLMNGALIKELDPHPHNAPITSVHFCASAKDRLVVTTSWNGALHVSDEADRAGFQEDKHHVKLRSILVGDTTQANVDDADADESCHDLLVSAVSFHLKQIATFAEKRASGRLASASSAAEANVICIWDLEFARLVGVCRADQGSQIVGIDYVNDGTVPLLIGLDAVHRTVLIWVVGGADRNRRFGRIAKVPLPYGMIPTALRVHDANAVLIGCESGAVVRMELSTAIRRVSQPVRAITFRGNRLVRQATRSHDIQRILATTPFDKFADATLRQLWLAQAGDQDVTMSATTSGPSATENVASAAWPDPGAKAVSSLSVVTEEGIILVGSDDGLVHLLALEDGARLGFLDAISGHVEPPLSTLIDLSHAQAEKTQKVKDLLHEFPSPRNTTLGKPQRLLDAASVRSRSTASTDVSSPRDAEPQTEHQRFDRAASVLFARLQALRKLQEPEALLQDGVAQEGEQSGDNVPDVSELESREEVHHANTRSRSTVTLVKSTSSKREIASLRAAGQQSTSSLPPLT